MNPSILGLSIGPGFLNKVPTLLGYFLKRYFSFSIGLSFVLLCRDGVVQGTYCLFS